MSLLRQLLLSVTLAILVILAGTTIFSIGSARQYLDAQLQGQSRQPLQQGANPGSGRLTIGHARILIQMETPGKGRRNNSTNVVGILLG